MLYDPSDCTSTVQVTYIPLTKRPRLKIGYLSSSLRFFNLPLGIGPNDRGPTLTVVIRATMYLPLPGTEPTFSVFLAECFIHWATVRAAPPHTTTTTTKNKGAVAGFVPATESNLRTAMGVEICKAFYYRPHFLQTACKDVYGSV